MRTARFSLILLGLLFILGSSAMAQSGPSDSANTGNSFLYQWFRDADGDGIPNGIDPDWYAPEDGSGYQNQNQIGKNAEEPTATATSSANSQSDDPKGKGDLTRDQIKQQLKDGSCK